MNGSLLNSPLTNENVAAALMDACVPFDFKKLYLPLKDKLSKNPFLQQPVTHPLGTRRLELPNGNVCRIDILSQVIQDTQDQIGPCACGLLSGEVKQRSQHEHFGNHLLVVRSFEKVC